MYYAETFEKHSRSEHFEHLIFCYSDVFSFFIKNLLLLFENTVCCRLRHAFFSRAFFFPPFFSCVLIGPKGGSRAVGLYEPILLLLLMTFY